MKIELAETCALNRFRLDVLNAGDIEEVIFVIRNEEAFHLRRIHAAVWLGHVDNGQIEIRKDVHRHPLVSKDRTERDPYDQNDDHNRTPQCDVDEPHIWRITALSVVRTV